MKHAGDGALDMLEELLAGIRRHESLKEKKRGIFYWKSKAFLHFHEDPAGLFADLRDGEEWRRFPVTTASERKEFLERVQGVVSSW